jgi:LCP family protein required for cell wall assembly
MSGDTRDSRGGRSGSVRGSAPQGSSPALATQVGFAGRVALLSFVLPGLGELFLGDRRRAAFRAVPILLVGLWLAWMAADGLTQFAIKLLDPTVAALLVLAIVATGIVRLVSIVDVSRMAVGRGSAIAPRLLGGLLLASVVAHSAAGWYAASFYSAGSQIFVAGSGGNGASPAPLGTGEPDRTLGPNATADPFVGELPPPVRKSSRINVLLVGADSGLGYTHALTDSQIVVSVDQAAQTAVMASIPRDIADFPFYAGGTFRDKINSLMSTAMANPSRYPHGGIGTLAREIGFLLGIDIHYYAFVNLAGFGQLIDAIGGVDIDNPRPIADPGYQFPDGKVGFYLKAGPQHLNSRIGLAFVRTRESDNDYERARRQQLVLQAIRDKITSSEMLPRLPSLLDALAKSARTDFPASRAAEMVGLAQQIPDTSIRTFVLGPPYAVSPPTAGPIFFLRPDMAKIRDWSIRVFGPDSAYSAAPMKLP